MALTDARGVPTSTVNQVALERFETALAGLQSYRLDPLDVIDSALADDPGFVLGHCLRATMLVIAAEKALLPEAAKSVAAAEALAPRANDRERGHVAAVRAWLDGDLEAAVDRWGAVLVDHPRDALALQAAHVTDFFLGRSSSLRDRVAQVLPSWSEAVPGYNFVLGMHAFGLEECGEYARAEAAGRRAVDLEATDAWAIHAVAHVLEMQGRQREGVDWLQSTEQGWAVENAFAVHNWWHKILYHLDLDQYDEVLRLYDAQVRGGGSKSVLDLIDASAMLWRLELRGVDVRGRWNELADAWAPMAEDGFYAFNDIHAMMAFVGAGRDGDATRLLATMQRAAAQGGSSNAMMTREVGLPVCRALRGFAEQRYDAVIDLLHPIRYGLATAGGSHAQRDVFMLTLMEAALRSGRCRLARSLAGERVVGKPSSPHNWHLMSRALSGLGQDQAAAEAGQQARRVLAAAAPAPVRMAALG